MTVFFLGTYHAVKNVEPCLSYSRMHLGVQDLPCALESLRRGDAGDSVPHEIIFQNAALALMKVVDDDNELIVSACNHAATAAAAARGAARRGAATPAVVTPVAPSPEATVALAALMRLRCVVQEIVNATSCPLVRDAWAPLKLKDWHKLLKDMHGTIGGHALALKGVASDGPARLPSKRPCNKPLPKQAAAEQVDVFEAGQRVKVKGHKSVGTVDRFLRRTAVVSVRYIPYAEVRPHPLRLFPRASFVLSPLTPPRPITGTIVAAIRSTKSTSPSATSPTWTTGRCCAPRRWAWAAT